MVGSPEVRVTTISGSGVTGMADGARQQAEFIEPFGVVYDDTGRLYVSDRGAQRIRIVERDGSTRTLAGSGPLTADGLWVQGGYRDGVGREARFNGPAGLAIARDGTLYVADANNHCIRRIDARGGVSTYAGRADIAGHNDGPRASATFDRPTGLAIDRAGNLYVADFFGIRMIAHTGAVATLQGFGSGAFGVSVVSTPSGTVIFAADERGLTRRKPDGSVERFSTAGGGSESRDIQGEEPLGHPFAIAAFDDHSIAFTDVRANTVRYLNWAAGDLQTLAGVPTDDGAGSAGGYRDGAGTYARFDVPLGIAMGSDGSLVVADGANKRLRKITNLDRAHDAQLGSVSPQRSNRSTYRIAFVGNSFLWQYTRWSDSIQGIVENALSTAQGAGRIAVDPYVFPGSAFGADEQYVEVLARGGAANFYVLNINPGNIYPASDLTNAARLDALAPSWKPQVTATLRKLSHVLEGLHAGLLVYTTPLPQNVSPVENAWPQLLSREGQSPPDDQLGINLNSAVRESGVNMLDLWTVFAGDLKSPQHLPLFGTSDVHFSYHGRAVVAREITKWFQQRRPWLFQSGNR